LIGQRNPAVLCHSAGNALTLDTKYDPPGTAWLVLFAIFVIVIISEVPTGLSGSFVRSIGTASIVLIYMVVRLWRQRGIKLDLGTAASEVIVDDKRRRIAFLTPIDHKARWIVLEFKDGFSGASGAIHETLGAKCRAGKITGVDMVFVAVVLTIIALFVGAFCYFILQATVFVPAPK
jgi:hypothetical protein